MRFILLGGDERQKHLKDLLEKDGHEVKTFALGMEDCLPSEGDIAVLPVPSFKNGYLNAPYHKEKVEKEKVFQMAKNAKIIFGAMAEGTEDYFKDERFTMENALITAECAINLYQNEKKKPVFGQKILVIGYGRIGKILALRLKNMGAFITVCARREKSRAEACTMGLSVCDTYDMDISSFEGVFNTVPAKILGKGELKSAGSETLFLELASAPYGIDFNMAEKLGTKTILAGGLPGKMMPLGAACAIKDVVYKILEEKYGEN